MTDERRMKLRRGIKALRERVDPPPMPAVRWRVYDPAPEGGGTIPAELLEFDDDGRLWEVAERIDGSTARLRPADLSGNPRFELEPR